MLRAAIYARFSTDMQNETTLDDQIRKCRQMAEQEGFLVEESLIFTDAAISGHAKDIKKRQGLARLFDAWDGGYIDIVLCTEMSRLGRDAVGGLAVIARLHDGGVHLLTADAYGNVTQVKRMRDFSAQTGPTVTTGYSDTVNNVTGLNAVTLTRSGDKNGDGLIDSNDTSDVATLSYDSLGRVKPGLDEAWYTTNVTEYDEVDRVVKATDAAGRAYETDRDDNGNVIERRVLVSGTVVSRQTTAYDEEDHVTQVTDNSGAITAMAYDDAGNLIQARNPDGYQVNNVYDGLNRLTEAYDAEGNLTRRDYDIGGRIQQIIDPFKVARSFTYYGAAKDGRLKRATLPAIQGEAAGRSTEYDYDAAGNITRLSKVGSDGSTRDHYKFYDELDRLVREVSPAVDGSRRQICRKFANLGDLTELWVGPTADITSTSCNFADAALKKQVTYAYDDFGRRIKETDPLNRSRSWTYDIHGKVLTAKDAKNQTTTFTWRADGLADTRKDHANRTTTWTYFPNGQVQTVVHPNVTYTYAYDSAQRLKTVNDSRGNKTLTYSYSNGGLLNRMTDGEGRMTDYLYDGVGRLIGQWMPNNGFVAWGYDQDGRMEQRWSDDGVTVRYVWNADGSLFSLENRGTGGVLVSNHAYTYNAFGQRNSQGENIAGNASVWRYVYDDMGQLREVYRRPTSPTPSAEAFYRGYRYDAFGNRSHEYLSTYYDQTVYDAAQQVSRVDRYSLTNVLQGTVSGSTFDANGSLLTKGSSVSTLTLTWDELNQVKTAKLANTGTGATITDQSYTNDAMGRRIAKTVGGATTSYVYDGAGGMAPIYAQYTAWPGDPQSVYAAGPGVDAPVAKLPLSGGAFQAARHYGADAQGTVEAVMVGGVSGSGAVEGIALYDTWGQLLSSGGTAAPTTGATFQGRDRDETALMQFRARYYDPATASVPSGRFVSRDPLGFSGGINLYAGFDGDPVNNMDPSGTTAISPAALNAMVRDWEYKQFMDDIGLGGMRSSNQSLTYAARKPDPHGGNTTQSVQTALGFASMVPGLGTVTGLANATIDLINGDFGSAAISFASAIPFVGVEAGALRAGLSAARGAETAALGAARMEVGVARGGGERSCKRV